MQCFPCKNSHKIREEYIALLIRNSSKESSKALSAMSIPCRPKTCKS